MATPTTLAFEHRYPSFEVAMCLLYGGAKGGLEMRVLNLAKSPLNIQKCLFPDCEFVRKNSGSHCVVQRNDCKFIVKVGLFEVKNVADTVFFDGSVSVFSSFEKASRTECLTDISVDDIVVIGKPRVAQTVKLIVVFDDIFDVEKWANSGRTGEVVKDVLKLFAFSKNSSVLLSSLLKHQKFKMNRIIVLDVDNSKSNQIFRIGPNTIIKIQKCISRLNFEQCQEKENELRIGGCKKVYGILKECIDFSKCPERNRLKLVNKLLLIGPAGCGKTTLVHNVADECKSILLEISASKINTLTPAQVEENLKNCFQEGKMYAKCGECCVILIENIDMISSGRTLQARKFLGQLIALLEEVDDVPGVVVVATTSKPDEVDSQLRRVRRLEDELEIMVPTDEERVEILKKILSHCKVDFSEELLQQVSRWTPGFVGADLRLLVVEALMIAHKKQVLAKPMEQNLLKDCFKQALTKVIPSALRGTVGLYMNKTVDFSQIGGLEDVKKSLNMLVKQQLENPNRFKKLGIPLTRGVLLYGPPGCAKTTIVKALAKECSATFLVTSAADLYSPFVGDAEKKIVQLFTQARIGSPSILFLDEIDAVIGSKTGDRERGVQERILSTLLIEMDGISGGGGAVSSPRDSCLHLWGNEEAENSKETNAGVVVIGATNKPQLLDDALKRPGRFDRLLYIPPPDEPERFRILCKLTEKMALHESVDLRYLAKVTNFYSGADLENLCQESGLHALRVTDMAAECIHQCHFEHVLREYKPTLNAKVFCSMIFGNNIVSNDDDDDDDDDE